ncbi:MAG: caspase family protein [Bacteroidota bacterium]
MRIDRIAMIVGIDNYELQGSSLKGCINDAQKVRDILITHSNGAPNFDCKKTFTSNKYNISSEFLLSKAEEFFSLTAQVALFYFSGHGFLNNLGGYLVTQDAKKYRAGVKMNDILIMAKQAREENRIQEIIIVLDCCHSGFLGESPLLKDSSLINEGISILAASRKYENAMEVNGYGKFTRLFINALAGGAGDFCGEVKAPAVYAYIDNALGPNNQRPIFKSNVSKLISIRNTEIDIESSILRYLPEYFLTPTDKIILDQSFLNRDKQNPVKQSKLFILQLLYDRQLIYLKKEKDLELGALKKDSCFLSSQGKYYWQIVSETINKNN